jgi:hypothetical protein
MKLGLCIGALTCALAFAVPARANSTEFSVTINAFWDLSAACIRFDCSPSPNPVVDTFSATFDEFANGTVVPGTMRFTFTPLPLTIFPTLPVSFGPPAACPITTQGCDPGFSGHTSLPGQQMWSDSLGYFVDFIPPSWPPSGSETLSATTTENFPGFFGPNVLGINCEGPFANCIGPLLSCYNQQCATGGDAPASGGTITITPVQGETPEPSTLLLLISGAPLVFLFRRSIQSHLTS